MVQSLITFNLNLLINKHKLLYKLIKSLYLIYKQIYTLKPYLNDHNVQQILSFQLHIIITRIINNLNVLLYLMQI